MTRTHLDDARKVIVTQGTEAWHLFRREHRMASTAAVVTGDAPRYWAINSPERLHRYNCGEDFTAADSYTKAMFADAHKAEADLRRTISERYFADFEPVVFKRGKYAASLDGWDDTQKIWLEIKQAQNTNSKAWKALATKDRMTPWHKWQLVHQAHCVPDDAVECWFVVCIRGSHDAHHLVKFSRKDLLLKWPVLQKAWICFASGKHDADDRLTLAALKYRALERRIQALKAEQGELKEELLEGGTREYPGVLKVTEYQVKGRINYRAAAEAVLNEGQLEKYRGDPTTASRITLDKGEA